MGFPTLTAFNLAEQRVTLPGDLSGERNLLLIAFQRWQQEEVDTWTGLAAQLGSDHRGFQFYELPTLEPGNPLSRWFINQGMRSGIRDLESRRRTITLYLDKKAFRRALDLPDEKQIHVLLVGRDGTVYWRAAGRLNEDNARSLRAMLAEWEREESLRSIGRQVEEHVDEPMHDG